MNKKVAEIVTGLAKERHPDLALKVASWFDKEPVPKTEDLEYEEVKGLNLPEGWRIFLSKEERGEGKFVETFIVCPPGVEVFSLYSSEFTDLKRALKFVDKRAGDPKYLKPPYARSRRR